MFTEEIYYADDDFLERIVKGFVLVAEAPWYQLYQSTVDKTFWRLDKFDKLQERFFVRLPSSENWNEFDSRELQMLLLAMTKGKSTSNCIWAGCNRLALQGMVLCESHAYSEMGVRR